jgi:photosystem II stability/assembly factor-like uncharacterized protein
VTRITKDGGAVESTSCRVKWTGRIGTLALLVVLGSFDLRSQNWMPAEGVPSEEIHSLVELGGSLYAAGETGIYRSSDGGQSWGALPLQTTAPKTLKTLFVARGQLYVGVYGEGVSVSSDGGTTWRDMTAGLAGWATYVVGLAMLGDSLYAGTGGDGVYVLNLTKPETWQAWNEGLPQFGMITIAASESHVFVSTGINVFARPRGGASWDYVQVDSVVFRRPTYRFLTSSGHLFAGTSVGVFRGTREGQSWRKMEIPFLANLPVESLTNYGTRIYAGIRYREEHFICSTDNAGSTWDFRAHELTVLRDLHVWNGRLWAARLDGLWSMDLRAWTSVEKPGYQIPSTFELKQNYPNPFNPSTNIQFDLPRAVPVRLEVYNILGVRIRTLIPGEMMNAGQHTAVWDGKADVGASVSSGVYFCRISAGDFHASKKLALVR